MITLPKIRQNGLKLDDVPSRGYPYLAEPLLQGNREQFLVKKFSENAIFNQLIARGLEGYIVEGVLSRSDAEHGDPILDVYDCWRPDQVQTYHGDRMSRSVPIWFHHRRAFLELCFDGNPDYAFVRLIEQTKVANPDQAREVYENHSLCGYLGTVFKQPGAAYCDCSGSPKKGEGPEEASGWQVLRRPVARRGYKPLI